MILSGLHVHVLTSETWLFQGCRDSSIRQLVTSDVADAFLRQLDMQSVEITSQIIEIFINIVDAHRENEKIS